MVKPRALAALAAFVGCTVDNPAAPALALDRDYFRCEVQPVLAARCAMPACHGSARRPLSIFAPGRMRWQVTWDRPTAAITQYELDSNFGIAGGFTTTTATGDAWLLTKPLATAAGGYYHRGADLYGSENVFATKTDAGYQILASWIAGQTAPASCLPITEVGP
jgi:hypothetical protein